MIDFVKSFVDEVDGISPTLPLFAPVTEILRLPEEASKISVEPAFKRFPFFIEIFISPFRVSTSPPISMFPFWVVRFMFALFFSISLVLTRVEKRSWG